MDARPIAFLIKRHQMQLTNDTGDLDMHGNFDIVYCLESYARGENSSVIARRTFVTQNQNSKR